MEITKTSHCAMDKPYAIQLIRWQGVDYCIAASEEREGDVALLRLDTGRVQRIKGLAGGCMGLIPDEDGSLFAIERFYPIFQSEAARIVRLTLQAGDGEELQAQVQHVADLPFVHRILTAGQGAQKRIVAGTLCTSKAFEQDWSTPGYVYTMPARPDATPRQLPTPLHKHHGMWRGGGPLLVSGTEGVFEVCCGEQRESLHRWLDTEVSDLCLSDLDGDGHEELVTIEGFHGDEVCVYRCSNGSWQRVAQEPVPFCHAIWAGAVDGIPCVLACGRGGDKETLLFTVHRDATGGLTLLRNVVDRGVGATNLAVRQQGGETVVYATNHGNGEIASYTLHL